MISLNGATTSPPPNLQLNEREQIQYVMGNPPSWMMRYGISVIVSLFALLLALAYCIHYPDIITTKVTLTTIAPPIRVLAPGSGRVSELLVSDREAVEHGAVLAVLENTAHWRDVLRLEAWLQSPLATEALPAGLRLGELQDAFSVLSQHWKDYAYFLQHNGVPERIAHLQKEIASLEKMETLLKKQTDTQREVYQLALKEHNRQDRLHREAIISDKEWEAAESLLLTQRQQLENAETATLENRMRIAQAEQQIEVLKLGKSDTNNEKELALAEDILRLRSAVAAWKRNFLVIAPITGNVSLSGVWSTSQPVSAGVEMLSIVPPALHATNNTGKKPIVGRAYISAHNSGKIAPGQRSIIRLDGYPANQYGVLEASVTGLSLLPTITDKQPLYLLEVVLPTNTLHTSYGQSVPFRQEMSGELRVITEDRRITDRIWGNLRDLVQNR